MGDDDLTARTLNTLAPLMAHILTRIGGVRASHGAPTTPAWEAPLPLNQDAFDDANWLWTVLTETVARVSARNRMRCPDIARSVWRNEAGKTVGLTVVNVDAGRDATATLTRWLRHNADPGELAWLQEAASEVAPRHPLRDRPHASKDTTCEDDNGTLIVKPPQHFMDDEIAVCQTCGRVYDQGELERAAVRYAAVQAAERVRAQAQKVVEHLTAKYGSTE